MVITAIQRQRCVCVCARAGMRVPAPAALCVCHSLAPVYYLISFFLPTETAFSCDPGKGKLQNREDIKFTKCIEDLFSKLKNYFFPKLSVHIVLGIQFGISLPSNLYFSFVHVLPYSQLMHC